MLRGLGELVKDGDVKSQYCLFKESIQLLDPRGLLATLVLPQDISQLIGIVHHGLVCGGLSPAKLERWSVGWILIGHGWNEEGKNCKQTVIYFFQTVA
jgi:hypothetical protein